MIQADCQLAIPKQETRGNPFTSKQAIDILIHYRKATAHFLKKGFYDF